MRQMNIVVACAFATLVVAGCAVKPMGPTVQVMPAANKSFEKFQEDQAVCKQFADQQVAGQAEQANNQALGAGLLGTGLGAALGGALNGGGGAGVGAASGAIAGTTAGAGNSQGAQLTIQQRYDIAYQQCMYAKGNQVPGYQPTTAQF